MALDEILLDTELRMEKAVEVLRDNLRGVRTGTASAGLVEKIRVDYYGSQTPLNQLCQIAVPDPQLIVIKPYDPASLGDIEKAIQASDVGINPQNDGRVIRLAVPPLSQERREQLVARVRRLGEEARVAIRNVRRDGNRSIDRDEKESNVSEDACRRAKEDVQDLTDKYEGEVADILEKKKEDVMRV
ncbi:MAG: ribosome recycling factor [Planctomycetes bacterium]|nr:ribosome recycling factor [Planctomycetota bacterium]